MTRAKAIRTKPVHRVCGCGCDESTRGGKFLPGHDARLKGALKKRAAEGDNDAAQELLERGWDLASLRASRERRLVQGKTKETPVRASRDSAPDAESAGIARATRLCGMIQVSRDIRSYWEGEYRRRVQVTAENYERLEQMIAAGLPLASEAAPVGVML